MKTTSKIAKLILVLVIVALAVGLTACDLFGGSLEMTSFVVNRASVKTEYVVGEKIDFSGISAEVKYNDAKLNRNYTFSELTIEYPDDITATVGVKDVKVSFMDPNLDVRQETTVQIIVSEDPNAVKHQSYIVKFDDMKTEYFVGEAIDFDGIKLYEKMSDNSEIEISDISSLKFYYKDTEITSENASSVTANSGIQTITLEYNGESVANTITVYVALPDVINATLNIENITKVYNVGDIINDFASLSAFVEYSDGRSETITEFVYVTDLSSLTATYGEKTVKVRFCGTIERTFNIIVDGVTDYILNDSNVKTGYHVGDDLDFSNVSVTAKHYIAENTKTIAYTDLTFVGSENATATHGTKIITVKYGDVEVGHFDIAVSDIIASLTVNTNGADLSYRVGEALNAAEFEKFIITVTYDNGDPAKTLSYADVTAEGLDGITNTAGLAKRVKLSYADDVSGNTISAFITFDVYGIAGYEIDYSGMKRTYYVGQAVNYAGLKVYALYNDGGEKVVVDINTLTLPGDSTTSAAGEPIANVYLGTETIGTIPFTVLKDAIAKAEVAGTYKNIFEKGTSVTKDTFTGLSVEITYLSGNKVVVALADLTFSNIDTSSLGIKTVIVTFKDKKNNEDGSTSFNVSVVNPKLEIASFTKPESILTYEKNNAQAGSIAYGEAGFSGTYVNKKDFYTVGSYNVFKFLPQLETQAENGGTKVHTEYYSDVTVYSLNGSNQTELSVVKDPASTNAYYYDGNVLMVTVNTYTGSYQFAKAANGKQFKISVLPSADAFIIDSQTVAAELALTVVDAYNVYSPKELSVIDNCGDDTEGFYAHYSWDDFKKANGIPLDSKDTDTDDINGIVLHNSVHVSADDMPHQYIYILEKDIIYKNGDEETTIKAGTRYLRDGAEIYRRVSDDGFLIEGNFFTIDTIKFPLVPSKEVFGEDSGRDYGSDFSNSTLIRFDSSSSNESRISISNIQLVGNAPRNNYTDSKGNLVSCGGLILMKSAYYAKVDVNNAIGNSYFISYYSEFYAELNITDVKCYNSYQNAAMVWSTATLNVNRCYFDGAGGPFIIAQSNDDDITKYWHKPVVNVDSATIMETHLTGSETWFASVNASGIVAQMRALSASLQSAGLGTFVNPDGTNKNTMNIKAVLMAEGSDAQVIVTGVDAEGTLLIGSDGIVRLKGNEYWDAIYSSVSPADGSPIFLGGAPILTVYDKNGIPQTAICVPTATDSSTGFVTSFAVLDMAGQPVQNNAALMAAFQSAENITLTQGGLTVIFEFYH